MAILVIAFSYIAFTWLAPWQLGKNADIVHRNERIEAALDQDPVAAGTVFAPGVSNDDEWTRVTVTGRYLPAEAVLRMRPVESEPAAQVLTAFAADDGTTYLVLRGWVSSPGADVPEIAPAPTGLVTLTGMARRDEAPPDRPPFSDGKTIQVYGINSGQVGEAVGADLAEGYIQLVAEDQPGVLLPMPVPKLDRGPHLSYGFQWIAFGIMVPAGLAYFFWAELREQKRAARESAELSQAEEHDSGASVSPSAEHEGGAGRKANAPRHSRKIEDRYAGTHHLTRQQRGTRDTDRF